MEKLADVFDRVDDQPVTVTDLRGVSRDGWCEPVVRVTLAAERSITQCRFDVWLKPEPDRDTSRLTAQFGDGEPFTFELPHDRIVTLQAACRAAPGEVVDGVLECDNDVSEKGADRRALSFKIDRVRFG